MFEKFEMQFTTFTAVAAPYEPVNVDTDQIIPARFLKFPRSDGYGKFLFHDVREDPAFVLNRAPFDKARILVANANFGCGSSREGAAYAFYDCGFRSVIAPSFGDIFFNNCLKNGIMPVRLPEEICANLRKVLLKRPGSELTVDLVAQEGAARAVMDEVAVDIEQGPAVLALDDGMALPDLVEQGTRCSAHCAVLSCAMKASRISDAVAGQTSPRLITWVRARSSAPMR